jgi:hypothetical protein
MTKQFPLLIFVLIFSGFCLAQDSDLEIDETYKQWDESLNSYLISHPNVNVQTLGLNRAIILLPATAEEKRQEYVDHIKQLFKNDTLSEISIFMLISSCRHQAIKNACPRNELINKYQSIYPGDLIAYMLPFSHAVQRKDYALAEYFIKNMRDASQVTDMTILSNAVKIAIKEFVNENPLPRKALKKQLKGLIDVDDSHTNETLNQAYYYIRLAGIKMALPIPAYKRLLDYCSSKSSPTEVCVEVANILITQGNDLISQLIGHSLKVKSYESSFESDLLVKAEDANDQFRKKYECIMNALSNNHHYTDYLDTTYAKIWFTSDNELHRIKSAAHYLFKKGQKAGSSDVIDPTTCEQTSDIPQQP